MNILVTGSSGFVGSHLLAYLKGHSNSHCIGLARASSKDSENDTVICDLNNKSQVDKLIKKLQPSLIFHAAGSFSNDFETDFQNNVRCTKNILDSVKENSPTSRVLLMGSAAEYGEISNDENPVTEDHPLKPISIYGWSKAAQTQLAHLYVKTYGVNIVIARTFNLIGKGMSDKLFVGRVERQIDAVLSGEAENISVGSLDAERDYIDIENACAMYYAIAIKGKAGEAYNVGSGTAISMKDLLNNLLHQAGLDESVIDKNTNHKNTPHSEVSVIYANISKVTKLMSTT
ncbi:MAG: NAD-dependent epimerase/dehydratase family protein [Gammaproteobacteria bacterium]|nr:NAD-dependent epimerase/dehydratase family protein [Gammaproteobacteria bacterium]